VVSPQIAPQPGASNQSKIPGGVIRVGRPAQNMSRDMRTASEFIAREYIRIPESEP
jgi:hypothetical protein